MKKILFVIGSLVMGGTEKALVNTANALDKKGYNITILIYEPIYDLASELNENIKVIFRKNDHKIMKKIPYIRHKFYDDGMWEKRASAKSLYRFFVGKEKYDVEIAFFHGLPTKIISGSTNKNSMKLAWVHVDFRFFGTIYDKFKDSATAKKAYKRFDNIICVSKQAKDSFIEVFGYKDKAKTIYNLLPIEKILKKSEEITLLKKRKTTICSVGRLMGEKGHARLLNVIERLNADGLDIDCWLIGEGAGRANLENIIEEKKLTNVTLLGKQNNPYKYMKQADLYICSSYHEGYNLTVAEALILGVPVLSTKCTGPCEILEGGEYGMLVENSEDGLYAGIKELLQNENKLITYKNKAKKRIVFFEAEKIIKEITSLF